MPSKEKKNKYIIQLNQLVKESPMALFVGVDFVGSRQMQQIRTALRGDAQLLMGKNTLIRTGLRKEIDRLTEEDADANAKEIEGLNTLVAAIGGNMGFLFIQSPNGLAKAREIMAELVVPAAAKAGAISPKDVWIYAGPSGLEPSQTNFFQALNIQTKIVKGAIDITADFKICTENERVSLSAQALLNKLCIKPFEYGMKIMNVFQDGAVFDAAVLDITDDVMTKKFLGGLSNVAAFGREIGIPTEAAVPHMFCNAFKNIVAACAEIDFSFEEVEEILAILKDPAALAAMQAAAASGGGGGGGGGAAAAGGAAAPAAAAAVEEEEEEDVDFDLFG